MITQNGFLWVSSYGAFVHTLQGEGAGRGQKEKGKVLTAGKPTWPSGTFSDLERECLTGVIGETAEQPTENTLKTFIAHVFGTNRINSLAAMPAHGPRNKKAHDWQISAVLFCLSQLWTSFFFPQGCGIQFSA